AVYIRGVSSYLERPSLSSLFSLHPHTQAIYSESPLTLYRDPFVPLTLLYCDPSCCPPTVPTVTTLKLLPYRADLNMSDQATPEVNTAADLAKLRAQGRLLTPQELKDLSTKIKTLEDIARLEDRLKAIENRKRLWSHNTERRQGRTMDPSSSIGSIERRTSIHPSIELSDSESSSPDTIRRRHKRRRYAKGIKINPKLEQGVSRTPVVPLIPV
ncbi:hypothetical protein DL95DRAFT_480587, partial [Leptodontidium sp. 2 PMI_412]